MVSFLGFCLLVVPFVAIVCFKSLLRGFLTIFILSACFHLLVALVTQSLGVFSYSYTIFAATLWALGWVGVFLYKGTPFKISLKLSIPIAVTFVIVVSFLVSIHYFYYGVVDSGITSSNIHVVKNSSYTYPFYSDEWSAIALINYSMESGSLPFVNPLNHNIPIINFLAGFHSLVSQIILVLNFDALTQYVWITIANGILTCCFVFLIVRNLGLRLYSAIISSLTLLFVTNSGNLAGIIYFIPYSLSLNFLLASLLGHLLKDRLITTVGLLLSLAIYPPMIVFAVPILVVSWREKNLVKPGDHKTIWIWGVVVVLFLLTIVYGIKDFTFMDVVKKFFFYLVRESGEGTVSFKLWYVIPVFFLPFVFIGLFEILRKKVYILVYPVFVGVLYWMSYCLYDKVFLIEYTRIVSITSIFLILVGAFGVHAAIRYLEGEYSYFRAGLPRRILKILIFTFFIFCTFLSSRLNLWHKLVLEVQGKGGGVSHYIPSPPVTRYLSDADLNAFRGIRDQVFISPRWKGLVVGVATHNFPLESKSSTITNKILTYNDFINSNCSKKNEYARRYRIDYVYSTSFSCESFTKVIIGDSGLTLYKVDSGL